MFKFFRRHRTVVMVSLAVIAVVLPFLGIGSTSRLPAFSDTIMVVSGRKVTQSQFDQLYNQASKQRGITTPDQRMQLTREVVDELVRREVFQQEAEKYGIQVSDQELQLQLTSIPAFQKEGRFDPQTYVNVLYQSFGTTPKEFEKIHRKDLMARKLNNLIASTVYVPVEVVQAETAKRLATEKDKEAIKQLKENPDAVREDLKAREANLVFRDWLNELNANLKPPKFSDAFRDRLAGKTQ